jgi:hypothetical protein
MAIHSTAMFNLRKLFAPKLDDPELLVPDWVIERASTQRVDIDSVQPMIPK